MDLQAMREEALNAHPSSRTAHPPLHALSSHQAMRELLRGHTTTDDEFPQYRAGVNRWCDQKVCGVSTGCEQKV